MTTYTKSTDFAVKDLLLTGNPNKLVKGSEVDVEFANLELSDATNIKRTSTNGSATMPAGTTAQRDVSPVIGYMRYNITSQQVEVYTASGWLNVDGGTGGAGNPILFENDITMSVNYTITTGKNAMSAGPITVDSGITLTVPSGSTYTVV